MIAGNQRDAEDLFPEYFEESGLTGPTPVDLEAQAAAEAFMDPEAAIDFTEVVWTDTTEEQYLEMVRLMEAAEDDEDEALPEAGEPQQDKEWV